MSNNTTKTAVYFKGSNSARTTLVGTCKAAVYNAQKDMTVVTIVTREEFTGHDGQPVESLREVPLYINGNGITAKSGDVLVVTGQLHLAEARGGDAKYPTRFERVMPDKVDNLGASMTNGLNQATIIGYVGNTRALKGKQAGLAVTVAVTRVAGGKEITDWHEAVFWGKRAENAGKLLGKGTLVMISGYLATRSMKVGESSKALLGFTPQEFTILYKKDGASAARSEAAEGGQDAAPAGDAFSDTGDGGVPF